MGVVNLKTAVAIRNRLQQWIDAGGLNYSQLAEKAGVSVAAVRSLAKNQATRVDLGTWERICTALDKPVQEMFYQEGDRPN
jgi:DNA-binding Xre family transcriptional regulator